MKAIKLAAVLVTLLATPAVAETNGTLRIGVLNDMSSVYADFQRPGFGGRRADGDRGLLRQSNRSRKVEVTSRLITEQARHRRRHRANAGSTSKAST